ncbi:hypothetical protein [Parvularcula sp. LCG005]|uniref:hypothetical protein n=1 Tax=Parvularcula sp. LCG005 TaxID=3078805 RepID=UPI002943108C|nr:hypothetical protein [Parvularcula sp. LCG005]WOI53701.1 hypothetical protein RUI03_01585 [Parvularcula sp. LCG005]
MMVWLIVLGLALLGVHLFRLKKTTTNRRAQHLRAVRERRRATFAAIRAAKALDHDRQSAAPSADAPEVSPSDEADRHGRASSD